MSKKIFTSGLIVGVSLLVTNFIVSMILSKVFPGITAMYSNTEIFRQATDPLMLLFFVYPLALGLILAWAWSKGKKLFKGSSFKRGANFGLVYALITIVPMLLVNISSFNLPVLMIFNWAFMSLVNGFLAGWLLVKLNK